MLGILVAGLVARSAFAPGVAGARASLRIEDDGQIAGVPLTIRGSGFGIGENVNLVVTHADGSAEPGMGHEPWTVIAHDGTFAATWSIRPSDAGGDRFLVRATGGLSGPTNAVPFGRMAFVGTDLFDYAPGEYARVTGGGFRSGEAVTLQVIHTRGGSDGGAGHDPWTVTADAAGNISTTWYVNPDDSLGAEFLLYARGAHSGLAATWAFMDAVCADPPPPDPVVPLTMLGVECPTNLNSCTANDVSTTVVAATPVDGDVCSTADDTVTLDFTVRFATTANQRYDLGVFIASDGLSLPDHTAEECAGTAPQVGAGDKNADPIDCDSDAFLDLDPMGHKVGDPDSCGDLQSTAGPVFITFRATLACDRFDDDNNLLVSSCRVWEQNANHETACTNLAQAGAGSKCDCTDLSFAGLLDPCVTAFCDDGNGCTADSCDSSSGGAVCQYDPLPDGSTCDDLDLCTEADACQDGECSGGPVSCDDGDVCTNDACDAASGCSHVNNTAPCGNGDFCDGEEVCTAGECTSPGNDCTAEQSCDEAGNQCVDCLDDSDCTDPGFPACRPDTGTCTECTANEDCQNPDAPFCSLGDNTCVECLTDAECDNGDFCDGAEVCTAGECTSPGNDCTAEQSCDEAGDRCVDCLDDSGCTAPGAPACEPLTGTCTECTANEDCQNPDAPFCNLGDNTCVECLTDAECDNGDFCDGAEVCTAGECSSPGNDCTAEQSCDEAGDRCVDCLDDSGCTAPGAPACEPLTGTCTECTASEDCQNPDAPFCNLGDNTCVECLTDAECDNGDFCDGAEVCTAGECSSPGNDCTAEQSCDEAGDRCVDCLDDSGCTAPGAPACEPLTGTCTECTASEDCQNPDAPFCSLGDNTCVECLTDAECDNGDFCDGAEVCTAGECSSPGNDCTAEQSCDEAGDRCVDCLDDSGCTAPGAPACEPLTGTCTECTASEDCQNPDAPFCNLGDNTCVECLTDAECDNGDFCDGAEVCTAGECRSPGNDCTAEQSCDEAGDRCVDCLDDSGCTEPGAPACEPLTGTCTECTASEDCQNPDAPFCNLGDNTCVECLTDAECDNGDFCDGAEVCTAGECSSPGNDCTAEQSCDEAGDRCVDCLDDSGCTAPGAPACEPLTGTCTECTDSEDCQNPDAPFCSLGDNTCVECLTDAECDNGDFCDGAEVCTAGECTSPGNDCTAEQSCDEAGDRCVDCLDDSGCTAPGAPACEPLTGTCTECTDSEDCQNPDAPFCNLGDNTCVECLTDAECDNGNTCDGAESCVDQVCRAGTQLVCNDGNPCTADSCNAGTGCVSTDAGDANDGSCESVTDSALCPFQDDTFRLIDLQNPTLGASGTVVQNDYMLNATNPGQTYYNVFYSGAPGSEFSIPINIPWPYVTHGANPIQVHDGAGPSGITLGDGSCFAPTPALAGFTITTDGGHLSSSGNAVILRGDYPAQSLGSTTAVHVSGEVPSSGLAYITIHLDYGLKKTTGWQQGLDGTTLQGPDGNLDGTPDGFGGGVVYIKGGTPAQVNGQDYTFSFSNGATLSSTVYSINTFKKNPGVNGLTLNASGTPRAGVGVQLLGPLGNMIASGKTDQDGFYSFPYKHTGKQATYTVSLPTYRMKTSVTLKANGYALLVFEGVPDAQVAKPSSTGGQKSTPMDGTAP